jgi:hypothetical protein
VADVIAMPGVPLSPAAIVAELHGALPEIASIACVVRYLDGSYSNPRSAMPSSELALAGSVLMRDAVESLAARDNP